MAFAPRRLVRTSKMWISSPLIWRKILSTLFCPPIRRRKFKRNDGISSRDVMPSCRSMELMRFVKIRRAAKPFESGTSQTLSKRFKRMGKVPACPASCAEGDASGEREARGFSDSIPREAETSRKGYSSGGAPDSGWNYQSVDDLFA